MSSFSDLVNSIGSSSKPDLQPIRPPSSKTTTPNLTSTAGSKSAPATPAAPAAKPTYKGTAGTPIVSQQASSLKRKADEIASERAAKVPRPGSSTVNSDQDGQKPSKPNGVDSKSPITSKPTNGLPPQSVQNAGRPPAKPPAKGSYAEIMARAKEAAQSKVPSQVGVIKHQATEKHRTWKTAERLRAEQEKTKGQSLKPSLNGKADPRRRSLSPAKPGKKGDATYPTQPKAPQPPLHGPSKPQAPAYKGTMGLSSRRSQKDMQKKTPRRDEYLATDEEDEGDYDDYGDEDDYGSDASSDMEGGFDDIEQEEQLGLKAAREDDARELELENKLKKEKMERKQKLAALAAKRR